MSITTNVDKLFSFFAVGLIIMMFSIMWVSDFKNEQIGFLGNFTCKELNKNFVFNHFYNETLYCVDNRVIESSFNGLRVVIK